MTRSLTALALTTSCSLLLSSCGQKVPLYKHVPIPADRMDCVYTQVRPDLPAEHQIDWARLKTLAEARAEHEAYRKAQLAREAVIARYIVSVEGVAFACANDAEWLRTYEADLAKREK